jgi:hypothetical protein
LGVGITTLPCKKKIVEKPPRNSAGFCGGGQGLSWAVEPRKDMKEEEEVLGPETVWMMKCCDHDWSNLALRCSGGTSIDRMTVNEGV